jgi:tetratricopeptide (TPR) repeat protein
MDEIQVFQLIAERENEKVEFKRLLDLESAPSKAEFIKDVISLANSAEPSGYMLVGVENNGTIVGWERFEEERIQQILSTYTEPVVQVRCHIVPTSNLMTVGVIEIRGLHKPHKVARNIERLSQNDVFVRHGSVVSRASPEEIINLHQKLQIYADVQQYVRAAVKHTELGNLQSAITAYSAAINLAPIAELFVARGKIYLQLCTRNDQLPVEKFARLAFDDFSNAIKVIAPKDVEKEARLNRLRSMLLLGEWKTDIRDQDIAWLRINTRERERGEVLYLEARDADFIVPNELNKAIALLDEAVQTGYTASEVFQLRAELNYRYAYNHGLALRDIDKAIVDATQSTPKLIECLVLKAHILAEMNRFSEAHDSLQRVRGLLKGEQVPRHFGLFADRLIDKILISYSLDSEFNQQNMKDDFLRTALQILTTIFLKRAVLVHGWVVPGLRDVVGADFWSVCKEIESLGISWYDSDRNDLLPPNTE